MYRRRGVTHVAAHKVYGTRAIGKLLVFDEVLPGLLVEVEHHQLGALAIQCAHRCRTHATGAAYHQNDFALVR